MPPPGATRPPAARSRSASSSAVQNSAHLSFCALTVATPPSSSPRAQPRPGRGRRSPRSRRPTQKGAEREPGPLHPCRREGEDARRRSDASRSPQGGADWASLRFVLPSAASPNIVSISCSNCIAGLTSHTKCSSSPAFQNLCAVPAGTVIRWPGPARTPCGRAESRPGARHLEPLLLGRMHHGPRPRSVRQGRLEHDCFSVESSEQCARRRRLQQCACGRAGLVATRRSPSHVLCRGRRSEPGGQRVSEAHLGSVSYPGHISVGPNQHGGGSSDRPDCRKLPRTDVFGVDQLHRDLPME